MSKFRKGTRVYESNKYFNELLAGVYPPYGTPGVICDESQNVYRIQWVKGSTSSDDCWFESKHHVVSYTKRDAERASRAYRIANNLIPRWYHVYDSVCAAYKKPSDAKICIAQRIQNRMNTENGRNFKVMSCNTFTFTTLYETEYDYVMDTQSVTYRYPKLFCKYCYNEYISKETK